MNAGQKNLALGIEGIEGIEGIDYDASYSPHIRKTSRQRALTFIQDALCLIALIFGIYFFFTMIDILGVTP